MSRCWDKMSAIPQSGNRPRLRRLILRSGGPKEWIIRGADAESPDFAGVRVTGRGPPGGIYRPEGILQWRCRVDIGGTLDSRRESPCVS